jgi:hypothetical protein
MAATTRVGVVYPGKGRMTLDGGQNSKFPRANILDNETPDCLNVVFSNGAVETRGGSTALNTTSVGTFVVDALYTRHDSDGSETMVVFAGDSCYALTGTSTFTSLPSAQSVFTAGVRVAAAEYLDYIFFGNGNANPHKYDGSVFSRYGVPEPATAPTATCTATGVLSGAYQYKVTYVNSSAPDAESDVSSASTSLTVAGGSVLLSDISVAPTSFAVSARNIYRTEAGGSTFKRLTTLSNNSATTFVDNVADVSLGVAAPSDNGVPPKFDCIVYHKSRIFCNDIALPGLLWFSEIAEPEKFPSINFVRVGDATGDIIRGLSVYNDSVLVFCDNSIWLVYMPSADPDDWSVIRIKGQYGCRSPFGLAFYNNKVLFPAVQNDKFVGFAAVGGDSVSPTATLLTAGTAGSDLVSARIDNDMEDVQEAYIRNISAIVYKQKIWIAVTHGTGAITNNRIYVLDFSTSNLSKSQEEVWVPFTGMAPSQFTIYDGKIYFGAATATGLVHRADTSTYNDNGTAINSYYWTKEFGGFGEHYRFQKDFREARFLIDNAGDWFMDLAYRLDSDSDSAGYSQQIDLNPGSSLWGTMMWGTSTWGGGSAQRDCKVSLGSARGERIQFKFSNQNVAGQYFKVHNLEYKYNIRGER